MNKKRIVLFCFITVAAGLFLGGAYQYFSSDNTVQADLYVDAGEPLGMFEDVEEALSHVPFNEIPEPTLPFNATEVFAEVMILSEDQNVLNIIYSDEEQALMIRLTDFNPNATFNESDVQHLTDTPLSENYFLEAEEANILYFKDTEYYVTLFSSSTYESRDSNDLTRMDQNKLLEVALSMAK